MKIIAALFFVGLNGLEMLGLKELSSWGGGQQWSRQCLWYESFLGLTKIGSDNYGGYEDPRH